jgi:hypothetical protein
VKHALALLWLSAQPPSVAEQATLDAWGRANGVTLSAPPETPVESKYDPGLVERIERGLEEGRKAIQTLDPRASALLDQLRAELEAHPELPQAAWLEAERRQLSAELEEHTTGDEERAAELRAGAHALEGARATTFERSRAEAPLSAGGGSLRLDAATVRTADVIYVDGRRLEPGERFAPGRHQVQLYRAARLAAAAWTELDHAALHVAAAPACSRLDLAGAAATAHAPLPDAAVTCPSWLAARSGAGGSVSIARCQGARCTPWSLVVMGEAEPGAVLVTRDGREGESWLGSAWLTWGAAAAGVAIVTSVVLWQAGAFDARERQPEFVFTGPSAAAFRF